MEAGVGLALAAPGLALFLEKVHGRTDRKSETQESKWHHFVWICVTRFLLSCLFTKFVGFLPSRFSHLGAQMANSEVSGAGLDPSPTATLRREGQDADKMVLGTLV